MTDISCGSIGETWSVIKDNSETTHLKMVHILEYAGTGVNLLTRDEIELRLRKNDASAAFVVKQFIQCTVIWFKRRQDTSSLKCLSVSHTGFT